MEEEKAQLHSDDVKLVLKELEGDKAVPRAGWSGAPVELPSNEPVEGKSELPVNEVVGSEMEGSTKKNASSQATIKVT